MSWVLPIAAIRTVVATSMSAAWGLGLPANRTKYPDRQPLDDLLDSKDALGEADGLIEQYFVLLPGIAGPTVESSTCDVNVFSIPLEIYICRRVADTPHDDALLMLERAGKLADALWAADWAAVTPFVALHMVQMTTRFPQAEAINTARFAAVLLSLNIEMEITP